jgi:drug/metabolite transporter (DMT)-like permease
MYFVLGWFVILIWAGMFTLIRLTLNCSNNNVFLVIMMYNITASLTSLFILFTLRRQEITLLRSIKNKKLFLVLILLNGIYDVMLALAIYFSSQVQFAIISNYLWPMLLVLFIHLIRKIEISFRTMISLLFGLFAVVAISIPENRIEFSSNIIGISLGILAAVLWSGYSALMQKEHENIPTIIQGSAQIISALCAFIFTIIFGKLIFIDILNTQSLVLLILFGIVLMTGNTLWILLVVKHPNVGRLVTSVYFVPILGVIIASIVFGNHLDLKIWSGLILVLIGTLISETEKKKILKTE